MSTIDILPNCVARESRGEVFRNGVYWVRVYCGNCQAEGGFVVKQHATYAFYLCDACHEKHGTPAGVMAIPDEVFWAESHAAMIEEYGRVLTAPEIERLADDPNSLISRLLKHRHSARFKGD